MDKYTQVFESLQSDLDEVEEIMINSLQGYQEIMIEALKALIKSGGKRIRPAITLLVGKMLHGDHQKILSIAAAIELLHTATLVHDDLIDGSLLRRGISTLNSKWSAPATVLSGDFLFACAAHIAADSGSPPIVKTFSKTLITICNGEIVQLFEKNSKIDRSNYYQRIYAKTATLFESCSCISAMIASQDEEHIEQMRVFGKEIGIAFQMMDDILDFTGAQAVFGKPIGSDLLHGIITLPVIYYVEQYPDHPLSIKLMTGTSLSESEATTMIEDIRNSSAISDSVNEARNRTATAIESIMNIPDSTSKQSLIDIAEFITERAY